jgi:hypothetical protein
MESLYDIPPGCICMGDGLMGMKCEATKHAIVKVPTVETRRIEFTIPQHRFLFPILRSMCIDSHRPELDLWAARDLYERVERELPHKTTRELMMYTAILKKLEWARDRDRQPATLAEIFTRGIA